MISLKLNKIRKKLDKLDDNLLLLVKKRTNLVNQVIQTKKYKNQIVDNKRINIILKRIKKKSLKMKIDNEITKRIWKAMIKAFINYEFKNFKRK